jgi:hypothetical protein
MKCPRCRSTGETIRLEHTATVNKTAVWRIWNCQQCSFTWRDSEPERTIDAEAREAWSRVYPDDPDRYVYNIPPAADPEKGRIFIHEKPEDLNNHNPGKRR